VEEEKKRRMIKRKLGKYIVKEWIGGGQFADVFLVFDTISKKEYALKVSRLRQRDMEMLKKEAQLLASLEHPSIVRFYSVDIIEDRLVLAMEFVRGRSVRKVIEEEAPLEPTRAISIVTPVLDALSYAHSKGILHRDIKPENILISDEGKVKLTDFGLGLFIRGERLTVSMAGTPLYMAPEAWKGEFRKESDLWSVGAVLYELLSGYPPFESSNIDGLREKILSGKIRPIPRTRPELQRVIRKALSRKHEQRFRSAKEFKEALLSEIGKTIDFVSVRETVKESPILDGLTEEQKEAVKNGEGIFLLLGGAGSGKTTALTHRVAYLIREKRVEPEAIVVLTFTGKAAQELKVRVERLIGEKSTRKLWAGTFHSLAIRILSRGATRIGFPEDFMVIGREDQEKIAKKILVGVKLETVRSLLKEIGKLKSELISPRSFERKAKGKWQRIVSKFYRQYQKELYRMGFLDFDDLLYYSYSLLREFSDLRETFSERFRYILVDEFQDINRAQFELLKILSSKHKNLFVTGDDDQAIYGFRGASSLFLKEIRSFFKEVKEVKLTQNFRSPPEILKLGLTLISHNRDRVEKVLVPLKKAKEEKVRLYAASDERDEAEFVASRVLEEREKGRSYEEIAILFRTHSKSRPFEEVLSMKGIPYNIVGAGGFYEREEVRASINFLKFVAGMRERESLSLILKEFLKFNNKEVRYALRNFVRTGRPTMSKKLQEEKRRKLLSFWEFIETVSKEGVEDLSPRELLEELYEKTGYIKLLERGEGIRWLTKKDNIDELLGEASRFKRGTLREFLSHIEILRELTALSQSLGGVRLMTVHSAKGLEFPVVFLVGLVEGEFPLFRSLPENSTLEEERRLCYVALTRAQEVLFLTYPKRRFGFYQEPSRFLYEMHSPPD